MLNVVKHSKATKAAVIVKVDQKAVHLTVSDNGIGFTNYYESNGIGLKTIQNKVKLLNGGFSMTSGKAKDSQIFIRISFEQG